MRIKSVQKCNSITILKGEKVRGNLVEG